MKERKFYEWLSTFKESIANYNYYIDFDIVYGNCLKYKIELNILNSLIGSKNIKSDFIKLINAYPSTLKAVPILLAKRENEIFCSDRSGDFKYNFNVKNYSDEQYAYFMEKTGLFELLQNHIINNLYDYVIGVETGLNTNGRKNRGGYLMENLVESFLIDAGFTFQQTYFRQVKICELEKMANLNLSSLSNNGSTEKTFDFAILVNNHTYAIECNFYASGGSKLNETARSYKTLAIESQGIKNFSFLWITDGLGWLSARNNLRETFDILPTLFNIEDLKKGIFREILIKGESLDD